MRSVWAISVNTLRQVFRLKIVGIFIILVIVLLPIMGFKMTGDGTIKGRAQSFVSYSMSLMMLLLSLLTIIATCFTLTNDIKDKQVYTVLTKPIRRYQFVLGKLFGIIILDMCLVILFSSVIYALAVTMPRYIKADQDELEKVHNEFFTARASIPAPRPEVTADVEKHYEKLKSAGEVPEGVDDSPTARQNYKKEIARRMDLRKRAAKVGEELYWEFENVRLTDPDQVVFVKFKYEVAVNPPDLSIYSSWIIGDLRQVRTGSPIITPIYSLERKDLIRTQIEFQVPGDCVADDGYLGIAFHNVPLNDTVVIFPLEEGLEILYKADTFRANFIRATILVFIRLVFLASLAAFAGSFLSFPVAILLCLAVFTMANLSGFLSESFDFLGESISRFYYHSLGYMLKMLPEFDEYGPTKFLLNARLISWPLVAKVSAIMVFFKSLPLVIVSLVIFGLREIAKVIV